MNRKYPKTTGYYNYAHILPNEMFYIGESGQQPSKRWKPSNYKNTVLGPYIKQYGWENIKHVVLIDGLTEDQSIKLEGLLIEEATRQGFCINEQGSGGKRRDNPKEYKCEYDREYHKTEKYKEYQREYRQRPKVKERQREYNKKLNQTEKRKEYRREYMREYRLKKKALI